MTCRSDRGWQSPREPKSSELALIIGSQLAHLIEARGHRAQQAGYIAAADHACLSEEENRLQDGRRPYIRFSTSPRAQYTSSYRVRASIALAGSEVTMKRGFGPLARCSALATTRRSRLQLSSVRQAKSAKRRAGPPWAKLAASASARSSAMAATRRSLRA